jgi:hypothetical protein
MFEVINILDIYLLLNGTPTFLVIHMPLIIHWA